MVKKLLFVLIALLLLVPAESFSQRVKKVRPPKDPEWELMVSNDGSLCRKPTFKLRNPKDSFVEWTMDNIKKPKGPYPGFHGTTVLLIHIEPDGKIIQADIVRSCGYFELDKMAVETVTKSPDWEPATIDGKPVPFKYTFPITFRIPVVSKDAKWNNPRI